MKDTMRKQFTAFFLDRRVLIGLLFINIIGSLYGYYWYRGQLASTNKLLLLFVPDSPLSTTLFSFVLFLHLTRKQITVLSLLASTFLVKYGLWAVAVNLHLLFLGEGFTWVNLMLALSHLGMAAEGMIYYPYKGISFREVLFVTGILAFQDFMDYVIGLHPYLFSTAQYTFALHTALILTGIILGFIWYHYRLGHKFPSYFIR
ncbi:MAG: DUF1405 domain-containing protein [Bacillota bacterium]|jgi:uncharacterized membrane protein YpjA